MSELEKKIAERIKANGPMTFEAFMEAALYEPGLGYYTSAETEIGRAGDYYTSSHLHPAFGAMLGRQVEEFRDIMGRPPDFTIIEMGAGRGYLAKDMLDYLKGREIYGSIGYFIVELSPFMEERQKALLSGHEGKIKWVRSLDEIAERIGKVKGCVLSNELLDAFPVHLIEKNGSLSEIYVACEDGRFREVGAALSTPEIENYLREFSVELPSGYRTEVNLRIKDWLKDMDGTLAEGFILTIDYGYPARDYYSEERSRGTLLCYKGHQVSEDPYEDVGKRDITAHVNFSSLKKWGEEIGLKTLGFCPQGTYLVSLGIDEAVSGLYADINSDSGDYQFEIAKIKRLILPGTLGETHKVMVQYRGKGLEPSLRGFSMRNQVRYL